MSLPSDGRERPDHATPVQLGDRFGGQRLLIVDNDANARRTLVDTLSTLGLHIGEARDGWDAMRQLSQQAQRGEPFDLVLMEWRMAGFDGVKCAKQIQETARNDAPVIVLMTAFGREDALRQLSDSGVRVKALLAKPLTASMFAEACMGTATDAMAQASVAAEKNEDRLRGAHILLVEDNVTNQEVVIELLDDVGVRVTVANNGKEGLELAQKMHFDGVLMDCQMPVMDGYEAAREIRKIERLRHLPIVAVTASAMKGDRERALEAGMNDYITKPIDPEAMCDVIAQWISAR